MLPDDDGSREISRQPTQHRRKRLEPAGRGHERDDARGATVATAHLPWVYALRNSAEPTAISIL
jgi:hypothetical protein